MKNSEQSPNRLLDRLKNFIDMEFNGSIASFSKWLDIPPTTVRGAFARESWPSSSLFLELKQKRPEINLDFFFGEADNYLQSGRAEIDDIESLPTELKREALEERYLQGQRALLKLMSESRMA